MLKFILRRTLLMIPQLILLSLIIFMLAKAMPGDAVTGAFQGNPDATPEQIEKIREKLGLNDPWYEQYGRWIGKAVQGRFWSCPISISSQLRHLLAGRIENTVLLSLFTVIVIYLIAIPLGIIAGRWTDTWADKMIVTYNYFAFATPIFVFALLMLFLFAFILGWFPTGNSVDIRIEAGTWDYFVSRAKHLILASHVGALIGTVRHDSIFAK